MTTLALTLSDFNGKFKDIKPYISSNTLSLINKSETMKEQIRSYQADIQTQAVTLNTEKPNSASYSVPRLAAGKLDKGFASFGINRINTPEGFIEVVSHELGHRDVEGLNSILGLARASAIAKSDRATPPVTAWPICCRACATPRAGSMMCYWMLQSCAP
jgi:hypothetical protein